MISEESVILILALAIYCAAFGIVIARANKIATLYLGMFIPLFIGIPLIDNIVIGRNMFHPEAVLGSINEARHYITYALLCLGSGCVFITLLLFLPRGSITDPLLAKQTIEKIAPQWPKNIALTVFVIGILTFASAAGTGGLSLNTFAILWSGGRFEYFDNPEFSGLKYNVALYFMTAIGVFAFFDRLSNFRPISLSVIAYTLVALLTIILGARQWLLLVFSGWIGSLLIRKVKSRVRLLLYLASGTCILITWQLARSLRTGETASIEDLGRILATGDASYFYYASLEAIRQFYDFDVSYYFYAVRNLAFFYLPSELLQGLKTQDLSVYFASFFSSDASRAGNYPPGYIGLLLLNFDFIGPVMFVYIICILLIALSRKLSPILLAVYIAILPYLLLQMFRGSLGGVYVLIFLCILFQCILTIKKIANLASKIDTK